MTTLATYTFNSGERLNNTTLRGYASGRYLNNTVSVQTPQFKVTCNGTILCAQTVAFQVSTTGIVWSMGVHFYVNSAVTDAGVGWYIGATMNIKVTQGLVGSRSSGGKVIEEYLVDTTTPLTAVPLNQAAANQVDYQIVPSGGDSLEVHVAYLEAL